MKKAVHEMAPTTKRSARLLSRVYGYKNPAELAASLPDEAVIADFGAGHSKFGKTIVGLRDDITWVNVDPRYVSFRGRRFQKKAPEGLHYLAGDVLNPSLAEGTFDRVFSSALLPHIVMTSRDLAIGGVHNMAGLLKENGELSTAGFVNSRRQISPDRIISVTAEQYHADPEAVASQVVDVMTLPRHFAALQKASNVIFDAAGVNKLS